MQQNRRGSENLRYVLSIMNDDMKQSIDFFPKFNLSTPSWARDLTYFLRFYLIWRMLCGTGSLVGNK